MSQADEKYDSGKDSDSLVESVRVEASIVEREKALAFEKKIMRRVNWRILPILALLYSFALIDRINIGAAYTAGMGADLELGVDNRLAIVSCLYFVPYILLQLPGNLVLRKFGVRNWLTITILAWGAVQLGMGFVPTWGYLLLTRVLLGVCEAPFFPAMLFIISTWYKRHEMQQRFAIFYLIAVTAGGLSPILAYLFSLMDGRAGLAGWRWIFVMEGAITLFLACVSWFLIPDFPDANTFLTPEETAVVLKRIDDDRGDSIPDAITLKKVRQHLSDWKLWVWGVMFVCAGLPNYAQSYFNPIIFRSMGWSKTKAILLAAPPYGPTIITTMVVSTLSDKYKHRSGFIAGASIFCLIGLLLTAFAAQNEVRYFGTFMTNAGNSACIPGILTYAANNVVSHSKRSVQSAMTVALGGIAGIMATTVFRTQDAPRYIPGLSVVIASQVLLLLLLAVSTIHLLQQNRLLREGKREPIENQPGFYFTL